MGTNNRGRVEGGAGLDMGGDVGAGGAEMGGGGDVAMDAGQRVVGGGGQGDLQEVMIVWLQTRLTAIKDRIQDLEVELDDRDAEIATQDVQLFARGAELTAVLRERDDAMDRLSQTQDMIRVLEGVQGQGATAEVMREM